MTPFDGAALLTILLAFYPVVSSSSLARARSERPEYFAGGTLFGSKRDKLQLPDGRVFDLIYAAGDPTRARWQVIEPGPGDASADPYPLEEGPLTLLEIDTPAPAPGASAFEGLVGGALDRLGASDQALGIAAQTIAESSTDAELFDAGGSDLDDADAAVAETVATRGAFSIADELASADAIEGGIATTEEENNEAPARPLLPDVPDRPRPADEEPIGTAIPR